VSLLGAGVAFFAVLSLAPALAAFVSIYGLVVSPEDIVNQVEDLSSTMPTEAKDLLVEQLEQVARANGAGLGLGAALGLALALWSASAAVKHLMSAVGLAYDEQNERGFVRTRLLAIALTLAGIVFMTVAVFVLTGLPGVADDVAGEVGRVVASWGRWPLLAGLMLLALAVVYRVAPDRDDPRWRWVTWGAGAATVAWLVACAAFSFYASRFGSYNETYGAMASVVVLMLWLYLTAVCVILGAEINAEMEHQTARDSTVGPPKRMGERSAEMADTVGPPADADTDAPTGVPEHAPG
jgi:membrane protein